MQISTTFHYFYWTSFLFLSLLLQTSCYYTHRLADPIAPPSEALDEAISSDSTDEPFETTPWELPDDWWTIFGDPQLSGIIQNTLTANPTIQAAHARILAARFQADKARATLYPTINLGGDVLREKLSKTGLAGAITPNKAISAADANSSSLPPAPPGALPFYFTQYETELSFTFDFDIWQKNRNSMRAAIGEMKAQIADEAFTRLNLSISAAQVYYRLQVDYKRLEIAQARANNYSEYADLIQRLVGSNLDSDLNLRTAQSNLAIAKQQVLQIEADIAINDYQLKAYLAGNFDEMFDDIKIAQHCLPIVPIPESLPLHLIAHRPDIITQLWLIESAGRRIEVAKAGFYPDFNLTGLIGFQTLHLGKLFQARSSFGDVDPAFSLPIFTGGLLEANLSASEVNYDLAIYKYNQLVLDAAKEVLTGIAVLRNAHHQFQENKLSADEQAEMLRLTGLRVQNHLNSRLDYLLAEQLVIYARDQEAISLGTTIQATLLLIKALGGGYHACVTYDQ